MKKAIKRVQSQARLNYAKRGILRKEKRLRLGARALKKSSRYEDFLIINKKADCT